MPEFKKKYSISLYTNNFEMMELVFQTVSREKRCVAVNRKGGEFGAGPADVVEWAMKEDLEILVVDEDEQEIQEK